MSNATLSLLTSHRSIRRYRTDEVPEGDILKAVASGQAASTSSAVQAYCLIHVRNPDTREKFVELTGGQPQVAVAGAFFVVCGDTRRHRLACQRAGVSYNARLESFIVALIDATLFAQNFVIAMEAMGYGICYIGGLRNKLTAVDELLNIPHGVYPLYGLCVGIPDEEPMARPRLGHDSVLFDDAYPDDATIFQQLDEYDARYRKYLEARGVPAEKQRAWSEVIAHKFSQPAREDIAAYYLSKGAQLD